MNYVLGVARIILTGIVALILVLLLAGCTVGPKYIKPTVPTTTTYKEEERRIRKKHQLHSRNQSSGSLRIPVIRRAAETGGRFLAIRNSTNWKGRLPVPMRT